MTRRRYRALSPPVWAFLTGAAQLVVFLRHRALLGNQWPPLLANGVSIVGGVAFVLAAAATEDPKLSMLATLPAQLSQPYCCSMEERPRQRLMRSDDFAWRRESYRRYEVDW